MMIGGFTFNDTNTSAFSLVGRSVKRPLLPRSKPKRVEMLGISGVYDFVDAQYEQRRITMRISFIGKDYLELRSRVRLIARWLSPDKWSKLIMDDEPDKYYLAKVTEEIDFNTLWESGSADVQFDCQPFAYSTVDEVVTLPSTGGVFNVKGTRYIDSRSPTGSKFIIEAHPEVDSEFLIYMNGFHFYFKGPTDYIKIDNVEMTVNMHPAILINGFPYIGQGADTFLRLVPGSNELYAQHAQGDFVITYTPMWY